MKMLALGIVFVLAQSGGCSNPNANGVQTFGSITGRVLDASNNRPVAGALISVGSLYTGYSNPDGAFMMSGIPIGRQDVTASAPGYRRNTLTVSVRKGQTADAGYLRIVPVTGGPTAPPPPPPATPTPAPTPVPVLTPQPSPSASAAP